jgi:adenylate cyclase
MSAPWTLTIYESRQPIATIEVPGRAELGRQANLEEKALSCLPTGTSWRVVVADKEAKAIPRRFVLVEPGRNDSFRITNLSKSTLELDDGRRLPPEHSDLIDSGVLIVAGDRRLRLQPPPTLPPLLALDEATLPPGQNVLPPAPFACGAASVEVRGLLRWLRSVMDVLQSAATSGDFFAKAARALVEVVRLDSGEVLIREPGGWREEARHRAPHAPAAPRPASQRLLSRVCQDKRTYRGAPDAGLAEAPSLQEVEAVVAAPILDRNAEVLGVLYGDRRVGSGAGAGPVSEVEALLVELLAGGVAAGLARMEQEKKALTVQVQFEQFFTADLARFLATQPDLLKGRDAEVTVLFCDVRGFTRLSERLGPETTMSWIGDVLTELSECVRREKGVLVDYVGDELLAMWGAPAQPQTDHAQRACRAALAMLDRLPRLDERWRDRIGGPTLIGVGVNTGVARVGNSGSAQKFKYGPLGNTVNLGSRVQGATKHLKCRLLITGSTAAKLDDGFARRRLCRVRVVNIAEPVDLFELAPGDRPGWADACAEYGRALAEFERRLFRESARRLADLRAKQPDDGPALVLLSRAVNCMVEEPDPFDPIWTLPSK